jgi:hypothetical protein
MMCNGTIDDLIHIREKFNVETFLDVHIVYADFLSKLLFEYQNKGISTMSQEWYRQEAVRKTKHYFMDRRVIEGVHGCHDHTQYDV